MVSKKVRRRNLPIRTLLLVTSLVGSFPVLAAAQPSEKDKAIAETLFKEGHIALERGETELACFKFRSSVSLFPVVNSRANVARCEEREGKLVDALKSWQKLVPDFGEGDERLKAAKERIAALLVRIPQLTLVLDAEVPASVAIFVDNTAVDRAALRSPLPLAAGEHTIVVQAAGRKDLRQTITLNEGDRREIRITPGQLTALDSTPNSRRTAAFVIGGVGLASFVVAGITGGLIVRNDGEIQNGCSAGEGGKTECYAAALQRIQDIKPMMTVNGVAWGVGLAGVGLGAILFISSGKGVSKAALAPLVLPGGGGASLTGRF